MKYDLKINVTSDQLECIDGLASCIHGTRADVFAKALALFEAAVETASFGGKVYTEMSDEIRRAR